MAVTLANQVEPEEQESAQVQTDREKSIMLHGKKWVRIDPSTKALHEASKTCFWKVIGSPYPAFRPAVT